MTEGPRLSRPCPRLQQHRMPNRSSRRRSTGASARAAASPPGRTFAGKFASAEGARRSPSRARPRPSEVLGVDRAHMLEQERAGDAGLGFGRIVASEIEVPNMSVNLV